MLSPVVHPSKIFVCQAGAYPRGARYEYGHSLARKYNSKAKVTDSASAIAYYCKGIITVVKSLIVQA
jgi:hypothetical protein